MIDLVFKNYTLQKSPGRSFFKNILEITAKELKLKNKIEISVNVVGESKIKSLNKKYRSKDKTTDVLSFPMLETGNWKLETDLGDIFICLSIAKKQAKSENINIEDKLAQLTVHGFLHLLGYEHEKSKKDAGAMFRIEGKILNKLNKK